jgi:hypothetical protein
VSAPRDGQPTGEKGRIKAEDIAAALAERPGGLRPGATALTPAQARRQVENKWVGEDLPPGYERGTAVVTDGRPVTRRDESQPLDVWDRLDGAKQQDSAPPARQAAPASEGAARKLIEDWKTHAAKVTADAKAARGTGREREKAAAASLRKTHEVGRRIVEKLSGGGS